MNWKNVINLIRVEMKSGRLLRGQRLTKYRENRFFKYLLYGGALVAGLIIGAVIGEFYTSVSAVDPTFVNIATEGMLSLLITLPTIVLIYSLVLTTMQQIQRSGTRFSTQAPYWLPITWEEHTLASVLADLLGIPLATIAFIAPAIIVFSIFTGQVAPAVSSVLAMLAAAFTASSITEILRILQVRSVGAVYKSTGRAAVWVRFIGSLLFFVVFYVAYFYVFSGMGGISFVQTVASAQSSVWFIPFVWLALTLSSFWSGLLLQGFAFLALSLLFIIAVFFLANLLNRRYGLYEPPAITVSRGIYSPGTGFLGRLGFSTAEAALIRKDLKAFTRRRELMMIFIIPIVVIIAPLMQSLGAMERPVTSEASPFLFALVFVFPATIMSILIGTFMIGEEGQAVWRIYSSPISPKSLVRSKYFFIIFFSILVLAITGTIGFLIFHPSPKAILVASFESFFLVFTLGAISLSNGIKGADFTEAPRARMIRTSWNFINLIACFLAAIALMIPFIPYGLSMIIPELGGPLVDPYMAVAISGTIATFLTLIFHRIALNNAKELLRKAEI
jgi:hypothetical protein